MNEEERDKIEILKNNSKLFFRYSTVLLIISFIFFCGNEVIEVYALNCLLYLNIIKTILILINIIVIFISYRLTFIRCLFLTNITFFILTIIIFVFHIFLEFDIAKNDSDYITHLLVFLNMINCFLSVIACGFIYVSYSKMKKLHKGFNI